MVYWSQKQRRRKRSGDNHFVNVMLLYPKQIQSVIKCTRASAISADKSVVDSLSLSPGIFVLNEQRPLRGGGEELKMVHQSCIFIGSLSTLSRSPSQPPQSVLN